MTRHTQILRDDFDCPACFVNQVFCTSNQRFLSNTWRCDNKDEVPLFNLNIAVASNRHLLKPVDRLTHTPCLKNNQLIVCKTAHVLRLNEKLAVLQTDFFHANGCADDIFHVKSSQDHLTSVLCCCIKDLLNTHQVAGYRCYNDTSLGATDNIINLISYLKLTRSLLSAASICRV